MQQQKQHDWDDEDDKPKGGQLQDIPEAQDAAKKGKDLLKRLSEKQRRGHWEECCGVRRWVED